MGMIAADGGMAPSMADLLNFGIGPAPSVGNGFVPGMPETAGAAGANPMAALGAQAMKNIGSMQPAPQQMVMPGAAIAPRGNQVQMGQQHVPQGGQIDPRLQAGLAALLFGGGQ